MNDIAELKQFVALHARGQELRGYQAVLDRIESDDTGPGSWVGEWGREAEAAERRGDLLCPERDGEFDVGGRSGAMLLG